MAFPNEAVPPTEDPVMRFFATVNMAISKAKAIKPMIPPKLAKHVVKVPFPNSRMWDKPPKIVAIKPKPAAAEGKGDRKSVV